MIRVDRCNDVFDTVAGKLRVLRVCLDYSAPLMATPKAPRLPIITNLIQKPRRKECNLSVFPKTMFRGNPCVNVFEMCIGFRKMLVILPHFHKLPRSATAIFASARDSEPCGCEYTATLVSE